jgi:hypothetical protein
MELPGCSSSPILDPDVYENFVHSLRARGPLNAYQGDAVRSTVSSLLDVKLIGTSQKLSEEMIVGRVFPRNDPSSEQPVVTTITGLATQGGDSLEMLIFPYQGSGAYSGMKCIHKFAKYRAQQAFSLFTLLPQYSLTLFHLRQASLFRNQSSKCLDKQYQKLKKKHPNDSEEDLIRQILKWEMPAEVAGSLSYFRKQLKCLLAMVQRYGLPTFFVTLNADEASGLRWGGSQSLEDVLSKICGKPVDWSSMPAENARLFLHRVDTFFRECLTGEKGILGRIGQYVIRYEFQDRGSLHAHILLWIHLADVERVTNEIVAAIPAFWNDSLQAYERPTSPEQALMYDIVMHKQQHKCRSDGFRADGTCKYGFPQKPFHSVAAAVTPSSKIWQYHRPRDADANTVPYHPLLLLLWGAHCHVQRKHSFRAHHSHASTTPLHLMLPPSFMLPTHPFHAALASNLAASQFHNALPMHPIHPRHPGG